MNTWIDLEPQISPKHIPRHENSFVQAGDKFYLFGGRESPTTVEVFDYNSKSWSDANIPAPGNFNHFQPVSYEGYIWVFCAFSETPIPMSLQQIVYICSTPAAGRWMGLIEIPQARKRGSAGTVVYNDKFYIVGGNTQGHSGGYVSWFDEYDPATNTWTTLPDAPNARDHFQSVIIGDKLFVSGGRQTGGTGGVFEPMIVEMMCTILLQAPGPHSPLRVISRLPVAVMPVVNFKGNLIVIGGEGNGQAWPTTEMLDINSGNLEYDDPSQYRQTWNSGCRRR